jgi:2'-5' RNA ligase
VDPHREAADDALRRSDAAQSDGRVVDPHREAADDARPGADDAGDQRVFFALSLAGGPRRRAEDERARLSARPGADAVRWVRPEGLHVTLRFLGAIAPSSVPGLLERVAARTRAIPRFELSLGGVSALPSPRRPRVVILEARPEPALQELAGAVERGVVESGLAPETRPFRAHVTLGRVRRGARLSRDLVQAMTASDTPYSEALVVTEATLFRSQLTRGGSIYTSIGSVPVGHAGPESPPNP